MTTQNRTIYLAGPITGHPDNNRPAFADAAERLSLMGYQVINPTDNDLGPDATWEQYMRLGLAQMLTADVVYMLLGWRDSRGATLEHMVATAIGMTVHHQQRDDLFAE